MSEGEIRLDDQGGLQDGHMQCAWLVGRLGPKYRAVRADACSMHGWSIIPV